MNMNENPTYLAKFLPTSFSPHVVREPVSLEFFVIDEISTKEIVIHTTIKAATIQPI